MDDTKKGRPYFPRTAALVPVFFSRGFNAKKPSTLICMV